MMKRVFNFLNWEFTNINQAALLLGFFALLSQILGLFRDRALAHIFGASPTLDVYYAAFRIPDFLYVTIASLAAVTALLPILNAKIKKDTDTGNPIFQEAKRFLGSIFTAYLGIMIVVSVVLYILMPRIAPFLVPGFSPEQMQELISISRIMLLSPIFMGLSNLFGSVTQMFRRFSVYALSPILYNVGILIGILVLYPIFGISGIAYGVVAGALLHGLIQLPVLIKHKFFPVCTFRSMVLDIKELVMVSLPRTLGLATTNLSILAIVSLASIIGGGAISVFQFSFNLQNVPLVLIGLSYSVAAFPTLSRLYTDGNKLAYVLEIERAAKQIIFWTLPMVFLFIVLRAQIVRVILGSGMFSWSDTRLTAACLAIFSVSVLAQGLILLIVRAYYAAGRTWRPLIINVITTGITVVGAYVFLKFFSAHPTFQYFVESLLRVEDIHNTALLMLPLAFSVGIIINLIWLWIAFRRDFRIATGANIMRSFVQNFAASFIMALVAYYALAFMARYVNIETFWGILSQGFFAGLVGIIVFIYVLRIFKNEQLQELTMALKTKFWKVPVIQESQSDL